MHLKRMNVYEEKEKEEKKNENSLWFHFKYCIHFNAIMDDECNLIIKNVFVFELQ